MAHKNPRRLRFWWALAVVLAIAVLATLGGLFVANKLTDEPEPPIPPPSGEEWDFGSFTFSPPEGWVQNPEVSGWTIQTNCAEMPKDCPEAEVYVDDLEACPDPYAGICSMDGPPIELEASRLCGWDEETDGPIEPEETNVGGKTAEFFTLNDCPGGSRSWWLVENILFTAEDPGGLLDLAMLKRILEEYVVWTS